MFSQLVHTTQLISSEQFNSLMFFHWILKEDEMFQRYKNQTDYNEILL
jgi:hypothetical protein